MANEGEDHALVADEETPTEFALMANTESKPQRSIVNCFIGNTPTIKKCHHLDRVLAIFTTKKRGTTMMHTIHTREFDRREVIICNEIGQSVRPATKENNVVGKFSRSSGTLAHTYSYCPLTYNTWYKVPDKYKMWKYVLEKYIVSGEAKPYVLQSIGACWRGHKSRLKKNHFYDLEDNNTRLKQHPDKEPPSLTKMFERTCERKKGHVYADTYDETERLIEQMKNYKALEEDGGGEDGSASVDPFLFVMNKEYNGHRRLFGKGVTNKLIKKVNGSGKSYVFLGSLWNLLKPL
nr:hypothetical protein [Tanacetum cinerariifolium]